MKLILKIDSTTTISCHIIEENINNGVKLFVYSSGHFNGAGVVVINNRFHR